MKQGVIQSYQKNKLHVLHATSFFGTRLLAILIFAVSVPYFISNRSEAEYGEIMISYSLLGLILFFEVSFGFIINQIIGRAFARSGATRFRLFSEILYTFLLCTLGVMFLFLAGVYLMGWTEYHLFYTFIACCFPALAFSGAMSSLMQAHNKLIILNISRFVFEFSKGLALIVAVLFFRQIWSVSLVLLIFVLGRAILDYYFFKHILHYQLTSFKEVRFKKIFRRLRTSLPLLVTTGLTLLIGLTDKLIVSSSFDKEAVAAYSLAFDVNTKAYFLVNGILTTLFTVILHSHAQKKDSQKQTKWALAATLVVVLGYYMPLFFYANPLISYWISPELANRVAPLSKLFSVASCLYLWGSVFESRLLAMGQVRKILNVYLLAVPVYFGLMFILPVHFQLIGTVIPYLILMCIYAAMMTLYGRRI